jgi:hypothetical protein
MPAANRVVCYTGVGAKKSGIHSDAEFLKAAMRAGCKTNCPVDLPGWVGWTGAVVRTPAQCRRVVKAGRSIDVLYKATERASSAFDACVEDRMCMNAEKAGGAKAVARCAAMRCADTSKRLAASIAKLDKAAPMDKKKKSIHAKAAKPDGRKQRSA